MKIQVRSATAKLAAMLGLGAWLFSGATRSWADAPSGSTGYDYGAHMMWGGGWYGMIFGPLVMVLVLAAVITAVVLLVRWLGGPWHGPAHGHHGPPPRTALDILKERFARGEIDKAEFEEQRRLLRD